MKAIKSIITGVLSSWCIFGTAFGDDLLAQIRLTQSACSGISNSMDKLKTMAGINTAVTAIGTVTGGIALGTGIAKTNVDKKYQEANVPIEKLEISDMTQFRQDISNAVEQASKDFNNQQTLSDLEKESKTLGKIRTGTLAGTAVMDTAGTIIAANNKVDNDLQSRINKCIEETKKLQDTKNKARFEQSADSATITKAENIIHECSDWEYIDLSSINKKAKGATISSGTGAALAIVGTITSASANSDSVRNGDADKEKNLNTASNILAGGTTVASGVATIFNATQISAIKKAVAAADKCEEALR